MGDDAPRGHQAAMTTDQISAEEFASRLVALCIGGSRGLPKKARDRHVVLIAACSGFERGMIYTESEVNASIREWLEKGCPSLEIDEVTIRRELIDASYLLRDDAGRFYALGPGPAAVTFSDELSDVDPIGIIAKALDERATRKSRAGT